MTILLWIIIINGCLCMLGLTLECFWIIIKGIIDLIRINKRLKRRYNKERLYKITNNEWEGNP